MTLLSKQISFVSSVKKIIIVSSILGIFLSIIIIFLEPFNTNEYESDQRIVNLLGFGFIISCVYLIQSILEKLWYNKIHKVWKTSHEIYSIIIFFTCSGTIIFLYNQIYINNLNYSISAHLGYYIGIVLPMVIILAPLVLYLRQKFGERIIPIPPNIYTLMGKNKNEKLELKKSEILYIQAEENYINIYFIDTNKQTQYVTFRQTLSVIHEQATFLQKCHRSYLINISQVYKIQGNSQSAKICFQQTEQKVPLSKTYYKQIKNEIP